MGFDNNQGITWAADVIYYGTELEEYYPGSKVKRKVYTPDDKEFHDAMALPVSLENPRIFTVRGKDVEFFTIGQVAMALNRTPSAIRKWEDNGIIPTAQYYTPSEDVRGKRRLWTKAQAEGMVRIAEEEGILEDTWKPISKTRFTERVIKLFEDNRL